jgi:hypothetical protein
MARLTRITPKAVTRSGTGFDIAVGNSAVRVDPGIDKSGQFELTTSGRFELTNWHKELPLRFYRHPTDPEAVMALCFKRDARNKPSFTRYSLKGTEKSVAGNIALGGFASLKERISPKYEALNLRVDKEYEGQGVARVLHETASAFARRAGKEVFEVNPSELGRPVWLHMLGLKEWPAWLIQQRMRTPAKTLSGKARRIARRAVDGGPIHKAKPPK